MYTMNISKDNEGYRNLRDIFLENVPHAKLVSNGKELNCRCEFCKDSINPRSRHMYIQVGNHFELPFYDCKLCNASGVVNAEFLYMYNIYNSQIINNIHNRCSEISMSNGKTLINSNRVISLINFNKFDQQKLMYINNRLGLKLTTSDCDKLGIVLDLDRLLFSNRILERSRKYNELDNLSRNYIGFLSNDNCKVYLRNINPEVKGRYRFDTYKIYETVDSNKRFYTIPGTVDLSKRVNVHISEGCIDILSIKYNVNENINNNDIYVASGGRTIYPVIKYVLNALGLINPIFHIYLDNDVDADRNTTVTTNKLKELGMEYNLYVNQYEGMKDFGVPKNNIKMCRVF